MLGSSSPVSIELNTNSKSFGLGVSNLSHTLQAFVMKDRDIAKPKLQRTSKNNEISTTILSGTFAEFTYQVHHKAARISMLSLGFSSPLSVSMKLA